MSKHSEEREAEERAEPANVRGAREDLARREPPFPGDGTNTGETTPEPGPEPGVTEVEGQSHPEVPFDLRMRGAGDSGAEAPESFGANATDTAAASRKATEEKREAREAETKQAERDARKADRAAAKGGRAG